MNAPLAASYRAERSAAPAYRAAACSWKRDTPSGVVLSHSHHTTQPSHNADHPPERAQLCATNPADRHLSCRWRPTRYLGRLIAPLTEAEIATGSPPALGDNRMMAIQAVAAQALAAVRRARSLFASSPQPLPAGPPLEQAAESTIDAGQRTAGLSGALASRHSDFVGQQAHHLANAGQTDTSLASRLSSAAWLTQNGAHQLDMIVDQTRTLTQAAAGARTPADQRMVLAALRSRLSAANTVVTTTQQQASAIANGIRGLDYTTGGRVQPAGFGPGGPPQEPAPKPPPSTDPDEAARRRDEALLNDPNADTTARRLAQERLNDLKYSKFIGPLTTDPVMGGDARTRAQARLEVQRLLESGQAFPDRPPPTPDEATQLLDKWETNGRQMILWNFANQLQQAGVSPPGIQRALDEIRSGKTPWQIIHDTGSSLSTWGGALGGGAEAQGPGLPGGAHWGDRPVWSQADAEALEAFGKRLGAAGIGLDALITIGDIAHGEPVDPAVAKFSGRTLGGIVGAAATGAAWGSVVGPEGTLIVGLLGAIAGAWGGEKVVKSDLGEQ